MSKNSNGSNNHLSLYKTPHFDILQSVGSLTRAAYLQEVDKTVVHIFEEIIYNILQGSLPLTQEDKKRLLPFESTLCKIVHKKTSLKQKRFLLSGSFLPFIISIVNRELFTEEKLNNESS